MRKSTFSKILFACFAFVALACAPKSAFAQHGGGGHGGGGFHGGGGGFHGGGGMHYGGGGGGFHVGGGFHGGAPGSNGVSRGRVGMAPSSSARFAPWATPRNFGNAAGRSSGTSVASAGHGFANADGQWHSFGRADNEPGPSVTARNFGNPAASTASVARGSGNVDSQWHSFGNAGNASVARASGASGPGGGAMAAKTQAPSLSAGSNRSLTMGSGATGSATKRWSGQGGDMWADNSRPTTPSSAMRTTSPGMTPNAPKAMGSAISPSRVLSSFGNSHFGNTTSGNSRFGRSSLGNSAMGNSAFADSRFRNLRLGKSAFSNSQFGNTALDNSRFGSTAFNNSAFAKPRFGLGTTFGDPFVGTGFGNRGFGFRGFGLPQRAFFPHAFFFDQSFFFSTSFFFGPRFFFGSPFFFVNPFFFPGARAFIFFDNGFFSPFLFRPVTFDPFLLNPFCPFCAIGRFPAFFSPPITPFIPGPFALNAFLSE